MGKKNRYKSNFRNVSSVIQNTMLYSLYAYIEKFSIPIVSSIVLPRGWMVLVNIFTRFFCKPFSSNFHRSILSSYPFPWLLSQGPALAWPEYRPLSGKLQNVQEGCQEFCLRNPSSWRNWEIQIRFQISWIPPCMSSRVVHLFCMIYCKF